MDVTVVPAIFPGSREDLDRQLRQLLGFADVVQINVVDGKFANPASWPYLLQSHDLSHMVLKHEMLPQWGQFRFEIDLMAKDVDETIGQWIGVGASRLTIHAESIRDTEKLLRNLEVHYGHDKDFAPDLLSVGFSIGVETDLTLVEPFVDRLDYVQFNGVARLGKHGEPFDARVIERIKNFKKKYPSMPIQADGGVSRATAPALLSAGVSRLVVGSDLWAADDRKARYEELTALSGQYGIYE